MMNQIVFDLEWNYAQSAAKTVKSPRYFPSEIIQIGAVKLDEKLNTIDSFSATIKPKYYTKVTRDVTNITTLTNKDLENGISFEEAAGSFRDWCGKDCCMITWSGSDEPVLRNNLAMFGLDDSWLPEFFDAQLMFDELEMDEGRDYPLNYAIYHFNIKPAPIHLAVNDAINTAEVLRRMEGVQEWIAEERAYRKKLDEEYRNNELQ